jgi:hypothetical protein
MAAVIGAAWRESPATSPVRQARPAARHRRSGRGRTWSTASVGCHRREGRHQGRTIHRGQRVPVPGSVESRGRRQAPDGRSYEGKLFATSADDATRYGRINYGLDNELFHLVGATVPRSFADGLYGGTADRMAQLDELNEVAREPEWDHLPLVGKP